MIARETSNRFKKSLITDKCQQKLGVFTDYTVHTGQSPPNYSLQTTARTHGSSPAEIDSELVSQKRLDISMVISDRHLFLSSRFLPPFDTVSVVPTAYRRFTVRRL